MILTPPPLVSVLMTVYNREKYLAEAIESVLASTYNNWELIITDDQSKDNSFDIAKAYTLNDDRIKVYLNEQNLGDYPNRNKAASYATGKYLKYVDADDMIYPYGLEILVNNMEQFPEAGYGLCSLHQDMRKKYPLKLDPKSAYQRHYFEQPLFHKAPLSSIIRKDAFDKIGGFSGKQHLGDFEMWLKLSQHYDVVLMPQGIVWYREHDDQQMTDNKTNPFVFFKYDLLEEKILKEKECPLSEKQRDQALLINKRKQANAVLSAYKHYGYEKGNELKGASGMSIFSIISHKIRGWNV